MLEKKKKRKKVNVSHLQFTFRKPDLHGFRNVNASEHDLSVGEFSFRSIYPVSSHVVAPACRNKGGADGRRLAVMLGKEGDAVPQGCVPESG
jgi:hypothetical protein